MGGAGRVCGSIWFCKVILPEVVPPASGIWYWQSGAVQSPACSWFLREAPFIGSFWRQCGQVQAVCHQVLSQSEGVEVAPEAC